jgi:hypothetical protein
VCSLVICGHWDDQQGLSKRGVFLLSPAESTVRVSQISGSEFGERETDCLGIRSCDLCGKTNTTQGR